MPNYVVGGQKFRRKNRYIPCAINATLEGKTDEEYVAIMKATAWADNITNAQWPVVLEHEGASRVERSRLKKKAVGWLMALSRIGYLNPRLYNEIVDAAAALYLEQIGEPSPMFKSGVTESRKHSSAPGITDGGAG